MNKGVLEKVKKEEGFADKEIKADGSEARREVYKGYYVFLIPINKPVKFRILALKAVNPKATQDRVFWVVQSYKEFQSQNWLSFKKGSATISQEKTLAEHLTALNEKSRDYKHVKYSEKSTKGIGKKYINATYAKSMGKDTFGCITYASNKLGAGVWLEGINYRPGWRSQGAFIIAVDQPQIMSFYAKKRISTQNADSQEKNLKFIAKNIQALEDELEYGNIVDLHMKLHNVPYYDIWLEITCDGKDLVKEMITLNRDESNPILDYNVEQRYELHIKPSWIETLNHEQGEGDEDSIKEGVLSITLVPNRAIARAPHTEDDVKKEKKEITFRINYKGDWAVDEEEQEWVPQIAQIQEATLATQEFEECGFKDIKITDSLGSFYILESNDNGGLKTNITTPILEFIGGNSKEPQTITIDLGEVNTAECQEQAGFDNTQDNSDSHTNNTFNTAHIPTETVNSELYGSITPVVFDPPSETNIELQLAYPYEADTYLEVFAKYMFGASAVKFPVIIQSCRYIRTPIINIYPDLQWSVHVNYAADKVLYYKNSEEDVVLIEFNRDLYDYLKPVVDFLYNKVMKPIEELIQAYKSLTSSVTGEEFSFLGADLKGLVEKFIESETETIQLGYHHKINGEIINYAEVKPINYFLYYYAFNLSLTTLALDLVILYYVTGRMKLKELRKAKNLKQAIKKISENKISFTYPKVSCNYGYEYEQMPNGKTALIIRFTLQAKPFLGVHIDHEVTPSGKLKDKLKANFQLGFEANTDINVKYNCYTKEWSLNENATDQKKALHEVKQNKTLKIKGGLGFTPPPPEVKNGEAFIDGDVIRTDLKIPGKAEISGKLSKEYKLIQFESELSIKGELSSFIGLERVIGFDNQRGPFTQERFFFSGLQYEVKGKAKLTLFGVGLDEDFEDKGNFIETFDLITPRTYIMQFFK